MSKSTATIPKSRSKYLIQFLKRKVEATLDNPNNHNKELNPAYNHTEDASHYRGNSAQIVHNIIETDDYSQK